MKKQEEPVKVNPFSLKRPNQKTLTKSYTDSTNPDVELSLSFRSLDQAELLLVLEQSEVAIQKYMGSEENPPMAFPPVDHKPVQMSQSLISNAAVLATMETSKQYTLEDFIAFSVVLPKAFGEMLKDANELNKGEAKNA